MATSLLQSAKSASRNEHPVPQGKSNQAILEGDRAVNGSQANRTAVCDNRHGGRFNWDPKGTADRSNSDPYEGSARKPRSKKKAIKANDSRLGQPGLFDVLTLSTAERSVSNGTTGEGGKPGYGDASSPSMFSNSFSDTEGSIVGLSHTKKAALASLVAASMHAGVTEKGFVDSQKRHSSSNRSNGNQGQRDSALGIWIRRDRGSRLASWRTTQRRTTQGRPQNLALTHNQALTQSLAPSTTVELPFETIESTALTIAHTCVIAEAGRGPEPSRGVQPDLSSGRKIRRSFPFSIGPFPIGPFSVGPFSAGKSKGVSKGLSYSRRHTSERQPQLALPELHQPYLSQEELQILSGTKVIGETKRGKNRASQKIETNRKSANRSNGRSSAMHVAERQVADFQATSPVKTAVSANLPHQRVHALFAGYLLMGSLIACTFLI